MLGMLIDSIMGTIDHIYCDNTFHVITEQNHRRNTIVRHLIGFVMQKLSEPRTRGFMTQFYIQLVYNQHFAT